MSAQLKNSLDREKNRMERFIQLYARHQQHLFSYVLALVPQWDDAEAVVESTQLVLWRKFEQYQEGTSFSDWAKGEAKSEVLKYRERRKKEWLCFSADVVKKLDLELRSMDAMLQYQRECLSACLAKLPEKSRMLLYHRYRANATVNHVAEKLGYSVVSVGNALQRIRRVLLVCVTSIAPADRAKMTKHLSATQTEEIETLCSALFDGSITADQFRLLQVYLRISVSSRRLFIQHRNLHGALAATCAYEVLPTHTFSGMPVRSARTRSEQGKREKGSPAVESTKRASSAISASSGHGKRADGIRMALAPLEIATQHVTATSLSVASLVTVLVLLTMAAFTPPGRRLFEQFTNPTLYESHRIARLTDLRDCEWLDPAETRGIGADLAVGQKLSLAKGLATIRYRSGVQVILQGPAVLEISRLNQSYLSSGKLTATVPSQAVGYTVETPHARVVDLGTEFAVDVLPGKGSEVHVFRGCVEAQWLGESGTLGKTVSLSAGKAARFEFGTGQESIPTFAAKEATFHRTLDRTAMLATKKASWREAIQRLRGDPELVLFYTFSGNGSNQREFANQAVAANKQFSCVVKDSRERGLPLVRGKWPWSAALDFAGDSGGYLSVDRLDDDNLSNDNLAEGRAAPISLGPSMSLVATVGSLLAKPGAGADGGTEAIASVASLSGPILMNRRGHSKKLDFQLAIFSSTTRDQAGKVEFRLNRDAGIERRVAGNGGASKSQTDLILSEEVDLANRRWHQIVAVCERLAVRLYWDGNQVGEQLLDEPLALRIDELSIGRGQSVCPEGKVRELGFEGLIDDLAVFKRPLKEPEIRSMADLY